MIKVVKFGGSSLASATQFKKLKTLLIAIKTEFLLLPVLVASLIMKIIKLLIYFIYVMPY